MKKKQSASGLFFSMFLRAIVVILAIVVVCLLVALIRSLIHGGGKEKDTTALNTSSEAIHNEDDPLLTATPTEKPTEAPTTAEKDSTIKIAVLNGTSTNGVAGAWREKLNNEGYNYVEAGNYSGTTQTSLIYFVKEGKGTELASYLKSPQTISNFEASNTDIDISEMDVVIVIGTADDIVAGQ